MKKIMVLLIAVMVLTVATSALAAPKGSSENLFRPDSKLSKLMGQYYGTDGVHVVTVGQNVENPDDLMVTLYIANASGKDSININNMRKKGRSWISIMKEFCIDPTNLFTVTNSSSVTEPFRHAYSEYRKWQSSRCYFMELYDNDIRNLVGLKFMVDKYKSSSSDVMAARARGVTYMEMIMKRIE